MWIIIKRTFENVINNWNIFRFNISINNLITKIDNIFNFKGLDILNKLLLKLGFLNKTILIIFK